MNLVLLSFLLGVLSLIVGIGSFFIVILLKQLRHTQKEFNELKEFVNNSLISHQEHLAEMNSNLNEVLNQKYNELSDTIRVNKNVINGSFSSFKTYFDEKIQRLEVEVQRVIRKY